jgi:hypothetical protein
VSLREKVRERVAPHLEEGEQLRTAFVGQTGPNPAFILLTYLVVFWVRHVVIAVTDRRVVVFSASMWKVGEPKKEIASFPPDTPLGDPSGLWAKVTLGGVGYWVNRRFHDDVRSAAAPAVTAGD